jgi:hypothetical protein
MCPDLLATCSSHVDLGQAQADATITVKVEGKSNLKRERCSTTTLTKPAKVARTEAGREYIDLASDSAEGGAKPERTATATNAKKTNGEIEVIDLL